MRLGLLTVVGICILATAAACGGEGGNGVETFDEDGFAIVFEHPSSLDEIEDVTIASTAGAASKDTSARGLDERNLILVSRYDLRISVGESNLSEVKAELDEVVSQAADQELSGTEIEVSGLPGYEYAFDLDTEPPVHSRFIVIFDGMTEYTLNCQSTSDHRDEIDAACQQAVDTLETS